MGRRLSLVCALVLSTTGGVEGQDLKMAMATIVASEEYKASSPDAAAQVSGWVKFTQYDACGSGVDPDCELGDVTIEWDMAGLTPGTHGFHVHQYGDPRSSGPVGCEGDTRGDGEPCDGLAQVACIGGCTWNSGFSTLGAHFMPISSCPVCDPLATDEQAQLCQARLQVCMGDSHHGGRLTDGDPPRLEETRRQPGDMGNIVVAADGTTSGVRVAAMGKMSLSDGLRSIVGRALMVHRDEDDFSQPVGNAGPPHVFGVIGKASPTRGVPAGITAPSWANDAVLGPSAPPQQKLICVFQPPAAATGYVIIEKPNFAEPNATLQALLDLPGTSEHSFHFHEWGDLNGLVYPVDSGTAAASQLGAIYTDDFQLGTITAAGSETYAKIDVVLGSSESGSLTEHLGISLTLHEGPTRASATIAAGVCGIAHPDACIDRDGGCDRGYLGSAGAGGVVTSATGSAVDMQQIWQLGLLTAAMVSAHWKW